MGEAQHGFQHAHQGEAGGALHCGRAAGDLHLGQFHIPVAIGIPHQFINGARGKVEAVMVKVIGHVGGCVLQAADHPLVGSGVFQRQRLIQPHILAFAVHQHEARGIPQLVAEVAVAFAALHVELDVAAGRGERGEGEAQGIGAEGGNALGEFLARFLCDAFRLFRIHQSGGAFLHKIIQRDAVD